MSIRREVFLEVLMKAVCVLSFLFTGSVVFAMPSVGDYAKYEISTSQDGVTSSYFLEQEVLSIDQAAGFLIVKETTTSHNVSTSSERKVHRSNWHTTSRMNVLMDNCEALGGKIEMFSLQVFGDVPGCRIESVEESSKSYFLAGRVAFGLLKFGTVYESGLEVMHVLREHHLGR